MAKIDRFSSSTSSARSSPSPSVVGEVEAIADDTLFVAVCREVEDSKSVLRWALINRCDSPICLIHVHQPEIPVPNEFGVLPMAHRVNEKERLMKKMDKHLQYCTKHGVKAVKVHIEMESVQEGIVKLIRDLKIGKLVMGAASDRRLSIFSLSKDMVDIQSEKAKYVRQYAPGYCHIWYICKKFLIHTREATEKFEALLTAQNSFVGNRSFSESSDNSSQFWPSAPESRIVKPDLMVDQLERRLESAMEQVDRYKKERDELQTERDNAIKDVEQVKHRRLVEGVSSVGFPTFYYELPLQEIDKATNKFDPLLKIREDAYENIYKGLLNLSVAVKVPNPRNPLSPQEFQKQVEILGKVRHPNMVNLISICPEPQAIIYEYCENGNLEDQLNSKVEWRIRIKISVELCNVLMFLHSQKPLPIIHGDIRPENIHLDSKYTCKLYRTDSRASNYAYTDPEYFVNEDLTTRSDVYSYGIVLLRLLTGKPAVRLTRQVQMAVDADELDTLLDPSAGWPLEHAKKLADLALRCCQMTSDKRPDLDPDVWKVLESMKGLYDSV